MSTTIYTQRELAVKISASNYLMHEYCTYIQKEVLKKCIGKNSISYMYLDTDKPFVPYDLMPVINMTGYMFYKNSKGGLTMVRESDIFYFSDQVRKAVKQKFKQYPFLLN